MEVCPVKDIQFLVDALDRAPSNVVLALIGPGSMVKVPNWGAHPRGKASDRNHSLPARLVSNHFGYDCHFTANQSSWTDFCRTQRQTDFTNILYRLDCLYLNL
eukprot:2636039-Amphidinium_carterae.1